MNKLTEAQEAALEKISEILSEHFDNFVTVFETEAPEGTDRLFGSNYHGSITTAIGLAERARSRWCTHAERNLEE